MANDINKLKLDVNEPDIYKKRSYIANLKHGSHFTCNATDLVPLDAPWPVLPGDTWKLRQSTFIRMTNPPKTPTMDQLVVDYYYFYTPYRILDAKFDDFITGNVGTQWNNTSTETVLYLNVTADQGSHSYDISGTLYDYLHMLPAVVKTNVTSNYDTCAYVQAYPVMNYYRIWNEYFRVEAFQSEIASTYWSSGSRNINSISLVSLIASKAGYGSTYGVGLAYPPSINNGILCQTARLGDYFTTAIPSPTKSGATSILDSIKLNNPLFNFDDSVANGASATYSYYAGITPANSANLMAPNNTALESISGNLSVVGSNTITSLKQAFAIDAIKTIDARYGQRITEFSLGHFGVVVPDYRVPRPEFLGKRRFYFNINQVIQSSETGSTPQGNAGAWGQTLDKNQFIFSKSFVEHGIIQGVMTIRVLNHSYANGLDRQFLKFNRFDFYLPALANISDMPIKKVEMYLDTLPTVTSLQNFINATSSSTFGYQEAWAEYKFLPNRVAGLISPLPSQNLAIWTYTDYYTQAPTLNSRWLVEPIQNIDNTLMIPSTTAPQFIVDVFFDIDAYRLMPVHSKIGVIRGW